MECMRLPTSYVLSKHSHTHTQSLVHNHRTRPVLAQWFALSHRPVVSCSVLHCDETATVNPLPVDSLSIAKKRIHRSVCVCMSAGCCVTVAAYICVWMYVFIIEEHAWLCVCEMEKERLHVCACACLCLPLNMRVYLCLYVCVCECWGEVVCAIAA